MQAVAMPRNLAPVFTDEDEDTDGVQLDDRNVPENSNAGANVGVPVVATDTADDESADNDSLTFELSGADAGLFNIASPSGQITVAASNTLNYETKATYTVTITVRDLEGLNNSIDLTIKVTDVNEAPTVSGVSSKEYAENGTDAVATFTAVDPEGDGIEWGKSGADEALFAISEDGVLTFVDSPDHEEPGDNGGNNIYEVTVTATDDDDSPLSDTYVVMVEVTNVEEAATVGIELSSLQPQVSTAITVNYVDGVGNPLVDANGAAYTGIVDPDRDEGRTSTSIPAEDVTWQWSKSSSKSGRFTDIPGDAAKTVSYTPGSSDRGMYLRVTGTYEDGEGEGKTVQATSAYTVRAFPGSNSAPAFSEDFDPDMENNQGPTAEIDDGATAGAGAGDPVTASDANNDRLTYSLTAQTGGTATDADVFQIDRATGQVTVGIGKTVHPTSDTGETASAAVVVGDSFTFTITATDPSGLTDTVNMTVTVDAEDEAPVFTEGDAALTFKENSTELVDTFAATDVEEDAVTFTKSGADSGKFDLTGGALSFMAAPDFETPASADGDNVYEITITAASGSGATENRTPLDVTVTVTNENDPGTISLSAAQPRVGTALTATNPSDTDGGVSGVTWKWESAAADNSDFSDTTAITEIKGATSASYTPVTGDVGRFLRATASYTDAHGPNKSASDVSMQAVAMPRNLAPVFTDEDEDTDGVQLDDRNVPENSNAGANVGVPVVATDTADDESADNDSLTFELSGADAGLFNIASPSGQITVAASNTLNYETKATYTVTITVRDLEGLNNSIDLTIKVTDINEAPEIMLGGLVISGPTNVGYAEDRTDAVATYGASGPNAAMTDWTLEGDDAASFMFVDTGASGMLSFLTSPDYENPADANEDNVYSVTLKATEGDDMDTHEVTVTVTDVVDEPMDLMSRYDDNDNGKIDRDEVLDGIDDFFATPPAATREEVLDLIDLFFEGLGS